MFWVDIMTPFGPMCVITSAIARFIPIFKLAYFWNAKTYTDEILIWRHIDGVLSEKPQNTHNLTSLFFNGCLDWKLKNCWNDWNILPHHQSFEGKNYTQVFFRIKNRHELGKKWTKNAPFASIFQNFSRGRPPGPPHAGGGIPLPHPLTCGASRRFGYAPPPGSGPSGSATV